MEREFENAFTLMPMSQDFSMEPGQTYEGSIKIVNPATAKKDFEYKVNVEPYNVAGDNYQIDLATRTNRTAIVDWITLEDAEGVVEPNSTKEIKFTINVPEDAAGGGQYASIVVASNSKETKNDGLAIDDIVEMASIIFGNVSGEIKHSGEIKGNSIPSFSMTVPIELGADFSNDGNVHESAKIKIKASNVLTGEVFLPSDESDGEFDEVIMPETERHVSREIDSLPMLGIIHIEQTIEYLGNTSVEAKNVIVCPLWFMILVIATIGAVIGGIVWGIILKRRKKAEIM